MEYKEYKPHPVLSAYIECYWSALADRPPFRDQESLIPDGTIELMFNFGDNYAQIKDGQSLTVKGSHVIGIRKHSLLISQTRKQHIFSIRFKPGGSYPFFRIPVHLFSNAFFQVEDLLGKEYRVLEEQMAEAGNMERVVLADSFLLQKINNTQDVYSFVARCSRALLQLPFHPCKHVSCTVQYEL